MATPFCHVMKRDPCQGAGRGDPLDVPQVEYPDVPAFVAFCHVKHARVYGAFGISKFDFRKEGRSPGHSVGRMWREYRDHLQPQGQWKESHGLPLHRSVSVWLLLDPVRNAISQGQGRRDLP